MEFPEGVIAITGPNGAGKSTLIEAVAWCLFGHEAARTDKELLKRSGAAPGEDAWVRLEFDLDGSLYAVLRRLRGKSQQTEAQVEVDGLLQVAPGANSSELASRFVARSLGMDRRGFLSTVMARQGDLSALGEAAPGERKRLILELLGIDALDRAIAQTRQEKREESIRLEEVRRRLAQEDDVRRRSAHVEREVERTRADLETATLEARQAAQRQEVAARDETEWAHARQRHREVRARLEGLQRSLRSQEDQQVRCGADVQRLEQRVPEGQRLEREGIQFADLDQRWKAFEVARERQAARERLEAEQAQLALEGERWARAAAAGDPEMTLEQVEAEVERARSALEAVAQEVATTEARAHHLASERHRLQTDTAQDAERWRDLHALGPQAPCPLCERPLGPGWEVLVERARHGQTSLQAQLRSLADALEAERARALVLRSDQDRLRAEVVKAEGRRRALHETQERQRVAAQEQARTQTLLVGVRTQLEHLDPSTVPLQGKEALEQERAARDRWREERARVQTETQRLPALRAELVALTRQVEETRAEIEAASRDLATETYPEGAWERAQARLEQERRRSTEAERRRDVLAERATGLAVQREQLARDVDALDGARSQAQAVEARIRLLDVLAADRGDQGLLPEFRTHLISRIRPALARAAGELVAHMTGGRYTELAVDEDYTLRLFDGARAWPLERFSGGERDVVFLAVRLAVSELLAEVRRSRRLQFVALDEVLASQDEARRQAILEALKALSGHFRQVFLVTHLEEVRERVDAVMRVVPDGPGRSRVEPNWDTAAPSWITA